MITSSLSHPTYTLPHTLESFPTSPSHTFASLHASLQPIPLSSLLPPLLPLPLKVLFPYRLRSDVVSPLVYIQLTSWRVFAFKCLYEFALIVISARLVIRSHFLLSLSWRLAFKGGLNPYGVIMLFSRVVNLFCPNWVVSERGHKVSLLSFYTPPSSSFFPW